MTFIKNHFPVIFMIIIELLFGILLLIDPEGLTKTLIIIFGIILMIIGIIYLIRYFVDRKNNLDPSAFTIVFAIISIILGIICTFLTNVVMGIFPVLAVVYGIFLIISGIYKLKIFFDVRRMNLPVSFFTVCSAVISIILGVLIIIHPFDAVMTVWIFTGIALIVEAIIDIIALVMEGVKSSRAKKA